MGFPEVQTALNKAVTDWAAVHGAPDLSAHDGPTPMVWGSKAELLAAWGHGYQLIQPEVIGKVPKLGSTANLVVDLRVGKGTPPRRMPNHGPYMADDQIQLIEDWIDAGCPD